MSRQKTAGRTQRSYSLNGTRLGTLICRRTYCIRACFRRGPEHILSPVGINIFATDNGGRDELLDTM